MSNVIKLSQNDKSENFQHLQSSGKSECVKRKINEKESDGDSNKEDETVSNRFANDGSFLELFKQMQEKQHQEQDQILNESTSSTANKVDDMIDCNKQIEVYIK